MITDGSDRIIDRQTGTIMTTQRKSTFGAGSRSGSIIPAHRQPVLLVMTFFVVAGLLAWCAPVVAQSPQEERDIDYYETRLDKLQRIVDARPDSEDEITTQGRALTLLKS